MRACDDLAPLCFGPQFYRWVTTRPIARIYSAPLPAHGLVGGDYESRLPALVCISDWSDGFKPPV